MNRKLVKVLTHSLSVQMDELVSDKAACTMALNAATTHFQNDMKTIIDAETAFWREITELYPEVDIFKFNYTLDYDKKERRLAIYETGEK
jgi:hypothetical protein